jgi:hypothetical protein
MSKIWLKPKVSDIVIWRVDGSNRHWSDEVINVRKFEYRYRGSYLRHVYLKGGCMIDQRHIVAILPPGSALKVIDRRGY